jgi:hypothetical protein
MSEFVLLLWVNDKPMKVGIEPKEAVHFDPDLEDQELKIGNIYLVEWRAGRTKKPKAGFPVYAAKILSFGGKKTNSKLCVRVFVNVNC